MVILIIRSLVRVERQSLVYQYMLYASSLPGLSVSSESFNARCKKQLLET